MTTSEASGPGAEAGPPPGMLLELAMSTLIVKALHTVAKLGIPDMLAAGPRTSADLAEPLGLMPAKLHQLLRGLVGAGVLAQNAKGAFSLTPVGETLQSGHPTANRDMFLTMGGPTISNALDTLPEVLATGKTGMELAFESPFFDYFQAHPDQSAAFNRMMIAIHGAEPAAVAAAYDFSGINRLVDVGGGIGTMLINVLEHYTGVSGVLFDFPSVVDQGREAINAAGLAHRCEYVTGDFFKGVPAGGDAYLLSHIIHDWAEDLALTILRNCREAMGSGGRLLLVEMVLPSGNEPHPGRILDLAMLTLVGGRERTAQEYDDLLAQAGFTMQRVVPTASPVSVVEAVPGG